MSVTNSEDFREEAAYLEQVKAHTRFEIDRLMKELQEMKEWKRQNREDELSERGLFEQLQTRMLDGGVTDARYQDTYERVLELSKIYYSPYFGRIDFQEDGLSDKEHYYIGKRSISDRWDPLVIDWRTPIASLFYRQALGEMSFDAPGGTIRVNLERRRQYVIKNGELQGFFDSVIDVQDDILQHMLSTTASDRLKEIVATIQSEQDRIIRAPLAENIMLDGVAGSGKTTIILHRVAYLLYNERAKLKDSILIVGPNQIFMEYISQVLPDLGEAEGTYQRTLQRLAREMVGPKNAVMPTEEYYEKLMHDDTFRKDVYHRASAAFAKEMDLRWQNYEEAQRVRQDIRFDGHLILSAEEANELFFHTFRSMPYNRRALRIKRRALNAIKAVRANAVNEIKAECERKIASDGGNVAVKNAAIAEREAKIIQYLQRVNDFRMELRKVFPVVHAEDWYRAMFCDGEDRRWSEEDLWAMIYILAKTEGTSLFRVRHLVVDEAQDVGVVGLLALCNLTGTESMTIVGDSRQKIKGKHFPSMLDSWRTDFPKSVVEKTRYCELHRSYRSTKEIMQYAVERLDEETKRTLDTVERPCAPVEHIEVRGPLQKETLTQAIENLDRDGMNNIAIVCADRAKAQEIASLLGGAVDLIENEKQRTRPDAVSVLPVYFAKGLEFDAVIAVDDMSDILVHYVLCTRALHRLIHIEQK